MTPKQEIELEQLVNECRAFEGRLYVMQLFNELRKYKEDNATTQIAATAILFMKAVNTLLRADVIDKDNIARLVKDVNTTYQWLQYTSDVNSISHYSKEAVFTAGRVVMGAVASTIGTFIGSIAGISNGIKEKNSDSKGIVARVATGGAVGAATGMLIGGSLGARSPDLLLKTNETQAIKHLVLSLENSLISLKNSTEDDYISLMRNELLHNNFAGDRDRFDDFCQSEQEYFILGIPAIFLSETLKGSVGHHALIQTTINDQIQLIELGTPTKLADLETPSQKEIRKTSGNNIISMLAFHRLLQKQYSIESANAAFIAQTYKPGIEDCNTYVDKILIAFGENATEVTRFTSQDTIVGKNLAKLFGLFTPIQKQSNVPSAAAADLTPDLSARI